MSGLSRNQRKALRALLATTTIRAAAEDCELSTRTLHRYLQEEGFKRALRARQDRILAATTAAMIGGRGKALETLETAQEDEESSWSVRVRAANYWLRHTADQVELAELLERVAAMEEVVRDAEV